jgi:hypothetical protein
MKRIGTTIAFNLADESAVVDLQKQLFASQTRFCGEAQPSFAGRRLIDADPTVWDRFCCAYDDPQQVDSRRPRFGPPQNRTGDNGMPRCQPMARHDHVTRSPEISAN